MNTYRTYKGGYIILQVIYSLLGPLTGCVTAGGSIIPTDKHMRGLCRFLVLFVCLVFIETALNSICYSSYIYGKMSLRHKQYHCVDKKMSFRHN